VLGGVGIPHDFDTREIEMLPECRKPTASPRPTSWRTQFPSRRHDRQVANGIEIGGNKIVVMAGPCSVESREQLFA